LIGRIEENKKPTQKDMDGDEIKYRPQKKNTMTLRDWLNWDRDTWKKMTHQRSN